MPLRIQTTQTHVNPGSPLNDGNSRTSGAEMARLQILWDKHFINSTEPVRYDKTVLLLLSWDETCDDLNTQDEVPHPHIPMMQIPRAIRPAE
jgi:hypothetical protein